MIFQLKPEELAPALQGADYSELCAEESSGTSIHYEDSRVEEIATTSDYGAGLRHLLRRTGTPTFETIHGSVIDLEPKAIRDLSRRLLNSHRTARRSALGGWQAVRVRPTLLRPPSQVPLEEKTDLLSKLDRAVRGGFPHIRQVSLNYAERTRRTALINSEGCFQVQERVSLILAIHVIAEKDGLLETAYEVMGGLKGFELLEEKDPLAAAQKAAALAVAKLSAPPAKAGEMPVVVSSSAGGTLIHEAIGHSLEADHVQEGTSPAYQGKVGTAVAGEFLSIVDDPTLPFFRGSYAFDDEGIPARPTALVERGVLKDYLHDRLTAFKDGKPSNGHGRRESFHHRPIPRMSNLYILPGQDDPAEILKSLKAGLFVRQMGGGQVDTTTGEFVFEVQEGYWVEEGKVRHLVRDANLLGVGPEVLKTIDRLGWDIGWGIGTCGKEGQGVPVSDGQPTLRIPKILVGGRHEG